MIGRVGTILGKAQVNIRRMDVGPSVRPPWLGKTGHAPDTALMIISVDDPIPEWTLEEIKGTAAILGVAMVKL